MSQANELRPPNVPKASIFPRARRVASLILSVIGIVSALFGAVAWIAKMRSEYDALRFRVGELSNRVADVSAQCGADKRQLEERMRQSDQASVQLRIAIAAIETWLRAQPARSGVRPSDALPLQDAKKALGRAEKLQPFDHVP